MQKTKQTKNDTQFQQSTIDPIFSLVKDKEGKVNVTIGKFLASQKKFKSFAEADKYLSSKPYEIIFNLACIAIQTTKDTEKEKNDKVA